MTVTNEQIMEQLMEMKGDIGGIKVTMVTKTEFTDLVAKVDGISGDLERLAQATAKGFAETHKKIDSLSMKVDDVEATVTNEIEDLARITKESLEKKADLEYA